VLPFLPFCESVVVIAVVRHHHFVSSYCLLCWTVSSLALSCRIRIVDPQVDWQGKKDVLTTNEMLVGTVTDPWLRQQLWNKTVGFFQVNDIEFPPALQKRFLGDLCVATRPPRVIFMEGRITANRRPLP
jgi:hypothetical protein